LDFNGGTARAQILFALLAVCAFGQGFDTKPDPQLAEALRLHQSGDVPAALPLYRAHLAAHPDSVDGLANYGAALAHEGLFDEAIAQYRKAMAIQPDNPQVLLNLSL